MKIFYEEQYTSRGTFNNLRTVEILIYNSHEDFTYERNRLLGQMAWGLEDKEGQNITMVTIIIGNKMKVF